jgi:NAD(P)H dehydrogenase (quinone)
MSDFGIMFHIKHFAYTDALLPAPAIWYIMQLNNNSLGMYGMHVFVVYCHPSEQSITFQVRNEFLRGLADTGHTYEVSDLYRMGFSPEFSEREYLRDAFYNEDGAVDEDVLREQQKIQSADAIVFIYPVFWTEAPAKLVGWFDRVWTCGFAYGSAPAMKRLKKALVIAVAGKTIESLRETDEARAMETVMLGDRIRDRAEEKRMVILDGTSRHDMKRRSSCMPAHLNTAYELGAGL